MLQRKAYEHLVKWKNTPDKKALLITGARQIGKTYIIRKFAEENYSNFIEINFNHKSRCRKNIRWGFEC